MMEKQVANMSREKTIETTSKEIKVNSKGRQWLSILVSSNVQKVLCVINLDYWRNSNRWHKIISIIVRNLKKTNSFFLFKQKVEIIKYN